MSHVPAETSLSQLGEFGLIQHLQSKLGVREGVKVAIGDDAALLSSLTSPLVTCDCLVEEVHFRRDWISPRQLGRKAMQVNVSDIAAMGGRPVAAFVTLALAAHNDIAYVDELYAGMEQVAARFGFTIAGGDTSRCPVVSMLSVTLLGEVLAERCPVLRSGARVGDVVLVTGTLGDSAAGLALLRHPEAKVPDSVRQYFVPRHLDPTARLEEMLATRPGSVHAALDLSDGLAGDARHIARASDVTLEIDVHQLPLHPDLAVVAEATEGDMLQWALSGGEDYELLLCVSPEAVAEVQQLIFEATGTSTTPIGRCLPPGEHPVRLVADSEVQTSPGAWTHF